MVATTTTYPLLLLRELSGSDVLLEQQLAAEPRGELGGRLGGLVGVEQGASL
jgi:hypothetical protein